MSVVPSSTSSRNPIETRMERMEGILRCSERSVVVLSTNVQKQNDETRQILQQILQLLNKTSNKEQNIETTFKEQLWVTVKQFVPEMPFFEEIETFLSVGETAQSYLWNEVKVNISKNVYGGGAIPEASAIAYETRCLEPTTVGDARSMYRRGRTDVTAGFKAEIKKNAIGQELMGLTVPREAKTSRNRNKSAPSAGTLDVPLMEEILLGHHILEPERIEWLKKLCSVFNITYSTNETETRSKIFKAFIGTFESLCLPSDASDALRAFFYASVENWIKALETHKRNTYEDYLRHKKGDNYWNPDPDSSRDANNELDDHFHDETSSSEDEATPSATTNPMLSALKRKNNNKRRREAKESDDEEQQQNEDGDEEDEDQDEDEQPATKRRSGSTKSKSKPTVKPVTSKSKPSPATKGKTPASKPSLARAPSGRATSTRSSNRG